MGDEKRREERQDSGHAREEQLHQDIVGHPDKLLRTDPEVVQHCYLCDVHGHDTHICANRSCQTVRIILKQTSFREPCQLKRMKIADEVGYRLVIHILIVERLYILNHVLHDDVREWQHVGD